MSQRTTKSGFTLVELIVTMGIFLLITSVVLAQYRSFGVNAEFRNAVEGVVLSIREAQVYGAGGKTAGVIQCGNPPSLFTCSYGVQFQNLGTSYFVFVDVNEDGTLTSSEEIQTHKLPTGITTTGITPASPLSIVFKRPFPDALINNNPSITSASVTLTKGGKSSVISITSAGQVSIQ